MVPGLYDNSTSVGGGTVRNKGGKYKNFDMWRSSFDLSQTGLKISSKMEDLKYLTRNPDNQMIEMRKSF